MTSSYLSRRQSPAVLVLLAVAAVLMGATRQRAVRPPCAMPNGYSVERGEVLEVGPGQGVLCSDLGAASRNLGAVLFATTAHGALTLHRDGSFVYTNDGSAAPTDSFSFKTNDGTSESAPVAVTITIQPFPVPSALADTYPVPKAPPLVVAAPGVLGNDVPNGRLQAQLGTPPSHGFVTLNADGSFRYDGPLDGAAADSFTYRAGHGGVWSAPATVTLTATTVAPPTVKNGEWTTPQGLTLVVPAPGVLAGAHSASGSLSAEVVQRPANGDLVLARDGYFVYTPHPGFIGNDRFTFTGSDGARTSAAATATIHVVAAGVPASDDSFVVAAKEWNVAAPGVLDNDSGERTILSYGAATGMEQTTIGAPTPTAAGGAVALQIDGSFSYTPPASRPAIDSFRYVGRVGPAARVELTLIEPVDDTFYAEKNKQLAIAAPGVLANDLANGATAQVVTGSTGVTLAGDGSFVYTAGSQDGSFQYTLKYGGGNSSAATVTIKVIDPLVARDDSYDMPAAQASLTVAPAGVLANDTGYVSIVSYGATGGEQTILGASTATSRGGKVALRADGGFTYARPSSGSGTEPTSDSFTYMVRGHSGMAAATVTINFKP